MKRIFLLFSLVPAALFGQTKPVKIVRDDANKKVDVLVDGKAFTSYIYPGPDKLKKAVLYPVRTSEGTLITRGWPMDPRPGERVDHPHHVGVWFNYEDVNGHDFWNNSNTPPNPKGVYGTIVHTGIKSVKSGPNKGSLVVTADWLDKDGKVMLKETTTYVFQGTDKQRVTDRITTLTAADKEVLFKDVKDGTFAIRLARQLEHPSTHEKKGMGGPLVYPKFSILDPETTYSLPPRQIANGIADAFTHVMEQYMTYPVDAQIQDRFAESVIQTLIEVAPKTLENPTDYEARANFMWAATVALNGWIGLGVPQDWATHQIGHEITAFHGVDHARTLAVVLPHLLQHKKADKREKLIQYAKRVWNLSGTDDELVTGAIQKTGEFYESLGLPIKASEYGVNKETIEKIKKRFVERGMNFGEKADITPEVVAEILEMSIA